MLTLFILGGDMSAALPFGYVCCCYYEVNDLTFIVVLHSFHASILNSLIPINALF